MKTKHLFPAIALLLIFAVGCANFHLPKTITQLYAAPQLKKRRAETSRQFNQKRDFMEYEAAKARWEQEGDREGCLESLKKLLARNPEHQEARMLAAELQVCEDASGDAIQQHSDPTVEGELVGYAMASAPMPPETRSGGRDRNDSADIADDAGSRWLREGRVALDGGYPQTALKCFRSAAKENPDNPQIPIAAAASALRANHPELAVAILQEAAMRMPTSAAVHRMLGAALYRMGDFKASEVSLRQSLSLDKSNALSYLLMGCALDELGQHEAAETNFRQAHEINPRYRITR